MDKQTKQSYGYSGINVGSSLKRNFPQTLIVTPQSAMASKEVADLSTNLTRSTADFLATSSLNRAPLFNPPPPKIPASTDLNRETFSEYSDEEVETAPVDLSHLRKLAEKYVAFINESSPAGRSTSAEFSKKVTEVLAFYSAPSRIGRLEALVNDL